MTEFRSKNGNVLIITEINGRLIASYNGEERFDLSGYWFGIGGEILGPMGQEPEMPPISTEKPVDDWQEWLGGECPFLVDERVRVRLRNGNETEKPASGLRWDHVSEHSTLSEFDIVAFKRL